MTLLTAAADVLYSWTGCRNRAVASNSANSLKSLRRLGFRLLANRPQESQTADADKYLLQFVGKLDSLLIQLGSQSTIVNNHAPQSVDIGEILGREDLASAYHCAAITHPSGTDVPDSLLVLQGVAERPFLPEAHSRQHEPVGTHPTDLANLASINVDTLHAFASVDNEAWQLEMLEDFDVSQWLNNL